MRVARIVTAIAAAAIVAVASAGTANADVDIQGDSTVWVETPGWDPGGSAKFYAGDEYLRVCDTSADGAGAFATLWRHTKNGWDKYVTEYVGGEGDCDNDSVKELGGGTPIKIRVELVRNGDHFDFSDVVYGEV